MGKYRLPPRFPSSSIIARKAIVYTDNCDYYAPECQARGLRNGRNRETVKKRVCAAVCVKKPQICNGLVGIRKQIGGHGVIYTDTVRKLVNRQREGIDGREHER